MVRVHLYFFQTILTTLTSPISSYKVHFPPQHTLPAIFVLYLAR